MSATNDSRMKHGCRVKATAPTALEAFSAALDYVAATYPGVSFVVDGPYPVGCYNGAVVTGSGYTFRAGAS